MRQSNSPQSRATLECPSAHRPHRVRQRNLAKELAHTEHGAAQLEDRYKQAHCDDRGAKLGIWPPDEYAVTAEEPELPSASEGAPTGKGIKRVTPELGTHPLPVPQAAGYVATQRVRHALNQSPVDVGDVIVPRIRRQKVEHLPVPIVACLETVRRQLGGCILGIVITIIESKLLVRPIEHTRGQRHILLPTPRPPYTAEPLKISDRTGQRPMRQLLQEPLNRRVRVPLANDLRLILIKRKPGALASTLAFEEQSQRFPWTPRKLPKQVFHGDLPPALPSVLPHVVQMCARPELSLRSEVGPGIPEPQTGTRRHLPQRDQLSGAV